MQIFQCVLFFGADPNNGMMLLRTNVRTCGAYAASFMSAELLLQIVAMLTKMAQMSNAN